MLGIPSCHWIPAICLRHLRWKAPSLLVCLWYVTQHWLPYSKVGSTIALYTASLVFNPISLSIQTRSFKAPKDFAALCKRTLISLSSEAYLDMVNVAVLEITLLVCLMVNGQPRHNHQHILKIESNCKEHFFPSDVLHQTAFHLICTYWQSHYLNFVRLPIRRQ